MLLGIGSFGQKQAQFMHLKDGFHVTAKKGTEKKALNVIQVSVPEGPGVTVCPASPSFPPSLPGWTEKNINLIDFSLPQLATASL